MPTMPFGTAPRYRVFAPLVAFLLVLLSACLLSACALAPEGDTPDRLSGEVTTNDGQALPAGSELELFIQEETEADVIGPTVAYSKQSVSGEPPFHFELKPEQALTPDLLHILRARILQDDRILYEKAAPLPVMTLGHPQEVKMELHRRP